MPQFTDLNSLVRYLESDIGYAMKIVANEVKVIIKDYVQKEVYNSYSPQEYQRTADLLNCIECSAVKKSGNKFEVSIFFNPDMIRMNEVEDNLWNQHMSVDSTETWNGVKINELIPYFINYGVSGSLWDRDGINSIEYVKKQLESTNQHLNTIIRILKSKGYNAKIG